MPDALNADSVRFRVCGCRADQPCNEAKHRRNQEAALTAQCWALHETAVQNDGSDDA